MKIIKKIIELVWPVIYEQLEMLVEKTDVKFDDYALEAVNAAIVEFLKEE
jgi:hypothetical protein